jgi:hypothetical protein
MATLNRRPLKVVPNPYCHIDHNGLPAGAYPMDFEVSAGRRMHIGAVLETVKPDETPAKAKPDPGGDMMLMVGTPPPEPGDHRWRFTLEPIDIDDTPYHRAGLREGSLLPADERTHRAVLGASTKYKPWREALAAARKAAHAEWCREHDGDEPAFTADADQEES